MYTSLESQTAVDVGGGRRRDTDKVGSGPEASTRASTMAGGNTPMRIFVVKFYQLFIQIWLAPAVPTLTNLTLIYPVGHRDPLTSC